MGAPPLAFVVPPLRFARRPPALLLIAIRGDFTVLASNQRRVLQPPLGPGHADSAQGQQTVMPAQRRSNEGAAPIGSSFC